MCQIIIFVYVCNEWSDLFQVLQIFLFDLINILLCNIFSVNTVTCILVVLNGSCQTHHVIVPLDDVQDLGADLIMGTSIQYLVVFSNRYAVVFQAELIHIKSFVLLEVRISLNDISLNTGICSTDVGCNNNFQYKRVGLKTPLKSKELIAALITFKPNLLLPFTLI